MGAMFPRVTDILDAAGLGPDLSRVSPAVLEAARMRGHAVHALIEADAYGYLDQAAVTDEVAPYFAAYKRFMKESGHDAVASEFEVVHDVLRYVGHPDRLGWLVGVRMILDWKTGDTVEIRSAARQLAAYRLAWNHMHPAQPVEALAVVQLRSDATYRFHEIEIGERERAERVFLAALTVIHARQEDAA